MEHARPGSSDWQTGAGPDLPWVLPAAPSTGRRRAAPLPAGRGWTLRGDELDPVEVDLAAALPGPLGPCALLVDDAELLVDSGPSYVPASGVREARDAVDVVVAGSTTEQRLAADGDPPLPVHGRRRPPRPRPARPARRGQAGASGSSGTFGPGYGPK